jgi:patatin-like phospholipase/acyl hydrolase
VTVPDRGATTVVDKLEKAPPYKLLALDGGGIRGVITLEVLRKIESMLQQALKRDDSFVLGDYFDYIAGTSTGAIIATFLSLGWRVADILDFYIKAGPAMFDKAGLLSRFRYKFEDEKLAAMLREQIGKDATTGGPKTLGDPSLRTLLMLVMRNATTDSPWPVSNNPRAKYNAATRGDNNLLLPLWQLVRASTAAPTYFPPETIQIGTQPFIFVDGGVTMYNNPAFQLFLMATLAPYQVCWETGDAKMLVVSVGTGTSPNANANLAPGELNLLYNASSIPSALMFAASNEQDFLCRTFGATQCGDVLDREVGNLIGAVKPLPGGRIPGPVHPKLFTYMRYNAELSTKGLTDLKVPRIVPEHVQEMDSVAHIDELRQVGQAVAAERVALEHFAGFLG